MRLVIFTWLKKTILKERGLIKFIVIITTREHIYFLSSKFFIWKSKLHIYYRLDFILIILFLENFRYIPKISRGYTQHTFYISTKVSIVCFVLFAFFLFFLYFKFSFISGIFGRDGFRRGLTKRLCRHLASSQQKLYVSQTHCFLH